MMSAGHLNSDHAIFLSVAMNIMLISKSFTLTRSTEASANVPGTGINSSTSRKVMQVHVGHPKLWLCQRSLLMFSELTWWSRMLHQTSCTAVLGLGRSARAWLQHWQPGVLREGELHLSPVTWKSGTWLQATGSLHQPLKGSTHPPSGPLIMYSCNLFGYRRFKW